MKFVTVTFLSFCVGSAFAQDQIRTETKSTKTTWNGVLVDAGCQSSHTERKETTREEDSQRTTQTVKTVRETVECPVTSATSTFGLRTSDGRFIRFDNPSNSRVIEIVKTDQSKYMNDRQPIQVRVIGTANGDVAVVESLNPEVTTVAVDQGPADESFDVRYHDDRGKLLVTTRSITFEDISNGKKSRTWSYAQIKELKRDGKEIKVEPYSGDSYELKFDGKAMSESVYRMIADRIVSARNPSQ